MERTYTRPLIDKLGVKPGARVGILGVEDAAFLSLLRERTDDITLGDALPDTDLVFLEVDSVDDLGRIEPLRATVKPDGAIWVVSPKGKGAAVRDVDVIEAAKVAGPVDNRSLASSPTHPSLRLAIPRSQRAR